MPTTLRFVFVSLMTSIVVVVVSILWVRVSPQPRPALLQTVYDAVVQTPQGQELSNVLGVASDEPAESINVSSMVGSVSQTAKQKLQGVVEDRLSSYILRQYERLPDEQKKEIQSAVCFPPEPVVE